MKTPGARPRWFHAWHTQPGSELPGEPSSEPDFADLGTAFGLDLSLMALEGPGTGCDESPRRTSDEGLEGADDPCRAWVR